MFAEDSYPAAVESGVITAAPNVRQFFDGERRAARLLAPIMGLPTMTRVVQHTGDSLQRLTQFQKSDYLTGPPSAYDSVFFFEPDAVWKETLPAPKDWITQLSPKIHIGLDPKRWFWEFDFYAELEKRGAEHFGIK